MVQLALCNALIIFRSALKPYLNQRMTFHSFQGENAAPTLKTAAPLLKFVEQLDWVDGKSWRNSLADA